MQWQNVYGNRSQGRVVRSESTRAEGQEEMTDCADCSFCGGRVLERQVQKTCCWGDKLLAIVGSVPAGVCEQCGEKYYKAKVLKAFETLLEEKKAFDKQISIPVADYKKALLTEPLS